MNRLFERVWDRSRSATGGVNIVVILLILLVVAAVYFAALLGPAYVESYKFKQKFRAVANTSHRQKDPDKLKEDILAESKILGLDLPYDAVKVNLDEDGKWMEFSARYVRVVELVPFDTSLDLEFEVYDIEHF